MSNPASSNEQTILELTPADEDSLDQQRALVAGLLADADSREKFKSKAGKLGTIHAILQNRLLAADQTYALQSLGIVFGDALAEELDL